MCNLIPTLSLVLTKCDGILLLLWILYRRYVNCIGNKIAIGIVRERTRSGAEQTTLAEGLGWVYYLALAVGRVRVRDRARLAVLLEGDDIETKKTKIYPLDKALKSTVSVWILMAIHHIHSNSSSINLMRIKMSRYIIIQTH